MAMTTGGRGNWSGRTGFILAAAGSAVGLGNIWGFPNQVASNGGAAFLIVYTLCCFLVGYPVMVAELSVGRATAKNPVGAFRKLAPGSFIMPLIGFWGVIVGMAILAFYNVIAGWTLSYVLEEFAQFFGSDTTAALLGATDGGIKSAIFALVFMLGTITIVAGGVSGGIERATKTMMPLLIGILLLMTVYVLTRDGSGEGLRQYLLPDFSKINTGLILSALGQAFFSLSLGMGALITYGSYLDRKMNIPQAAGFVTLADFSIAFLAGLLILPAMYVAQSRGVQIVDDSGALIQSTGLVFNVLPELFHQIGGITGLVVGVMFFFLLTIAALTSTISLLEVPVSYLVDEHGMNRKKASILMGAIIGAISLIIAFDPSLIGLFVTIFNNFGLPVGGLMICLFVAYYWKTEKALKEMEDGYEDISGSAFASIWPIFVKFICPLLIALVFLNTLGVI